MRGATLPCVCWLGFYIMATSKILSGWLLTSDSAHSWRLCSPVGDQPIGNITEFPTQSHYPDTEIPNPYIVMLSTRPGKRQVGSINFERLILKVHDVIGLTRL